MEGVAVFSGVLVTCAPAETVAVGVSPVRAPPLQPAAGQGVAVGVDVDVAVGVNVGVGVGVHGVLNPTKLPPVVT